MKTEHRTQIIRMISTCLLIALLVTGTACGKSQGDDPIDSVTTTAAGSPDITSTSTSATESTTEPPVTETTTGYADALPEDLDLKGTTIRIASRSGERYVAEFGVTAQTGEIINDALYTRDRRVEERLNCLIQTDLIPGHATHGPVRDGIEVQLKAGDCEYDVVAGSMYMSLVHASNGYYLDLMQFSDIIDTNKSYWSTKFIEQAKINNKLYTLTGDAALTSRQSVFMTLFNKNMLESYKLEDPYELVRKGQWTIDKLTEMTANIYQDLNGDGIQGPEDLYGFTSSNRIGADQWLSALDITILSRDTNGALAVNINEEKYYTAYEKVYKLFYQNGGTYAYPYKGGDAEMDAIADSFAKGQFLFATNWLRGLEQQSVRGMTDSYGVLPNPKYDEAQSDYYTFTHDQLTVLSIPYTVGAERAEAAVAPFLEALASESQLTLIPQYYEVALKAKLVDAPDDAEMLDIISAGICVDFSWMCQGNVGGLQQVFRNGIIEKTEEIASLLKAGIAKGEASLKGFVKKFE